MRAGNKNIARTKRRYEERSNSHPHVLMQLTSFIRNYTSGEQKLVYYVKPKRRREWESILRPGKQKALSLPLGY
jgi:hypothetical protein